MSLLNLKASRDGHKLVLALRERGCVSRAQLMKETSMSARQLRLERHESQGRVISGNFGYCLFSEAEQWMREEAAGRMEHQAHEMKVSAMQIRKLMENLSLCRP